MKEPNALKPKAGKGQIPVTENAEKLVQFDHRVSKRDFVGALGAERLKEIFVPLLDHLVVRDAILVLNPAREIRIPLFEVAKKLVNLRLRRDRFLHIVSCICRPRAFDQMLGQAPKDRVIQGLQCCRPPGIMQFVNALQLLGERARELKSPYPVEAAKELRAPDGRSYGCSADGNLITDIGKPFVMIAEVGWSHCTHRNLLRALERCVAPAFLVEQDGRLIETLLEILLAVLQRFDAPLQQQMALLLIGAAAAS